ncbi:MAG: sugar ABC transporter ATP-binding protein [Chloroflexi bacterium]|nr:MAG: D-xylose ABC transporter ATP-binding protein [Phototrophicales bacterium]RMF80781.1 MAG: sugar ABC transporter ATP-binding protein [Chloroflexota bacterium]
MTDERKPILTINGMSKRFGATQALDKVSLTLYPGEVHALLGENGAGKSTLIKIMTGIYQPDEGQMLLDGKPIEIHNTAQAQSHGIAAIYQEPMIFPDLNVAENIFISHQGRGAIVNWGKMYRDAEDILAKLGVHIDVRRQARGLTLAAQQTVEIAKALSLKTRVLIMDEPTASLSAHEVAQLFRLVRNLRDQGVAILFISHRLEEVFEISDRITIFRDGQFVSSNLASDVTTQSAIHDMVGRDMESFFVKDKAKRGELLLSVRGLTKYGKFSDISFDVYHGEVLGFAGLVGAGRTDVALALFGIEPADEGQIIFDGEPITMTSPAQATDLGIAYVPEDRREHGLVLPMSIASNITLPILKKYLGRFGLVNYTAEHETAEAYRKRLSIRTNSVDVQANDLSGGNQQKVVLSKWLNTNPRLLILDEPTRGIDVGAKAEVHSIVNQLAQDGLGIILISSDLPEVLAMSDRVLVMREGQQMGIFEGDEIDQEVIMTAAMGQAEQTRMSS